MAWTVTVRSWTFLRSCGYRCQGCGGGRRQRGDIKDSSRGVLAGDENPALGQSIAFALRWNGADPRRPGTDVAQEADAAREGKAGEGGKGRAVAPGDIAVKGGRQRAGHNEESRRPRRDRRQQEERLRQGVAAEIGAGADLGDSRGRGGGWPRGGRTLRRRRRRRRGRGTLPARRFRTARARGKRRGATADYEQRRRDVRKRPGANPFQPQHEGRARVVCALEVGPRVQALDCRIGSVFTSWTMLAMPTAALRNGASSVWCPASTWAPEEQGSTPWSASRSGWRLSPLRPCQGERGSIPGERSGSGTDPPAFRRERLENRELH